MMACTAAACTAAALAGCSADGNNQFAARDTTVEYYRVFDIRTDAGAQALAKAASEGINRNVRDAVISTPATVDVTELPGHFKMADPAAATASTAASTPGAASAPVAGKGPTCEGAAWTAKAAPQVRGGDNMNMVACLFPYKSGYHLDMYAVFTKPEGGWLAWPRRLGGAIVGTPEKFTENTMVDVVRSIHGSTGAQVTLVEAKPALAGTPWLENTTASAGTPAAPAAAPASAPASALASAPAPAAPAPSAAPAPASETTPSPVVTSPVTSPVTLPVTSPAPSTAAAAQHGVQPGVQSGARATASTSKQP
ncbi:hypothetical protein [Massilia sp. 9096]|uniref:hypothetical protein n=1 Tax=Massilia sp. 9096 TaxID=1500894 RepID=UPI00068EF882|nr:hypothetical protein [Massilia sp. 9096]